MATNYLNLKFNGCSTKIELLNTPVTWKWIDAFNQYKKYFKENDLQIDYKLELLYTIIHNYGAPIGESSHIKHPSFNMTSAEAVDAINKAIEDVNTTVDGMKFPYPAYLGMPWHQTNFIHRCFTTALMSSTNWQHNLTYKQLIEFKKEAYENKKGLRDFIQTPQFKVTNKELFFDAIERINKYVHFYETFHESKRAYDIVDEINDTGKYLELGWDSYNSSGHHTYFFGERVSYDDVVKSIPENWQDYDIFIGKSIAGKDYEFSYCEYDNPLEYDITNLDHINGSLRIMSSSGIKKLYSDSSFSKWCREAGLEDPMFLPIPIGKIVDSSCDFSQIEYDHSSQITWSNGAAKAKPPFDSVESWLSNS